jgi:hypothetical protein
MPEQEDPFASSRASLALLLLGRDPAADPDDAFPRSTLMRFVMKPKHQALLMGAFTLASLVLPRTRYSRITSLMGDVGKASRSVAQVLAQK